MTNVSDKSICKFFNIKDQKLEDFFNKCTIKKIRVFKSKCVILFLLITDECIISNIFKSIIKLENQENIGKYKVQFIFESSELNPNTIKEYLIFLIQKNFVNLDTKIVIDNLKFSDIIYNKDSIVISLYNKRLYKDLTEINICFELDKILKKLGLNKQISIKYLENSNFCEVKKFVANNKFNKVQKIYKDSGTSKKKITKIQDIKHPINKILIEAQVFDKEIIKLKNDKLLLILKVTDFTDSIIIKKWTNSEEDLHNYCKGEYYRFEGSVKTGFIKNNSLEILLIRSTKISKPSLEDKSIRKRVELHAHTKMSQLDSIVDVQELIDTAREMGHKAIAITDHSVVHAFPQAFLYSKKYENNPKIIYGCELNVYDPSENKIFYEELELKEKSSIKDINYIVFDIETTGLSANYNKIIEIAALKIHKGQIIDKFQTFIDPEEKLSDFTINLTNIKQKDVEGKGNIKDKLNDFIQWCNISKESVFVAHNANFDIKFLKSWYFKTTQKRLFVNYIDTLQFSRYLYPKLKRHGLKYIAKHLYVPLVEHHRAMHDTEATAKIFNKIYERMIGDSIYSLRDINNYIDTNIDYKMSTLYHVTVLAKNKKGLKNLYKIISLSHTKYFHRKACISKILLEKYREDLLIGTACYNNDLFNSFLNDYPEIFAKKIEFYDYVEIQPPMHYFHLIDLGTCKDIAELHYFLKKFIQSAYKCNKKIVATGNVHILDRKDNIFRKIYIDFYPALHFLAKKGITKIPECTLLDTNEMLKEFQFIGNSKLEQEIVVENTNWINDQIESIEIIPNRLFAPKMADVNSKLITIVNNKIKSLYGNNPHTIIKQRIEKELDAIIKHNFTVIYYICHKIVNKSLIDGYIVGSRGSVGSSFIAYLMDITEVNPLPAHYLCNICKSCIFMKNYLCGYDLPSKECEKCNKVMNKNGNNIPFETFLGFKGDKVPDIDLNFSGEYQYIAHNYTRELFGKDNVFRAGTITTIANKTAFGYVKKFLEENPSLHYSDTEIDRIVLKISGVKKTNGRHAGGIIVVPDYMDIHDITPVQYAAEGKTGTDWKITHFDFTSIHDNLLKLDLLGHDDPTIIRMLQDLTKISPQQIPLDDKKVYSLFTSNKCLNLKKDIGIKLGSLGIPEFGTEFVRNMLEKTKPKTFSELVQISGLSHGTDVWLNNAEKLIQSGTCSLKNVIGCRDDIMVYLISKGIKPVIAFEIMELVRKGKFNNWEKYYDLLKKHNVEDWYIDTCRKIKYMFPKAHAVAYVISALRISWFKVYKPLEFYASIFSVRYKNKIFDIETILDGFEAVKNKLDSIRVQENKTYKDIESISLLELILEMLARGFNFKGVNLYSSDRTKFIIEDNHLVFPFQSIEGVGENVAKVITIEREKNVFLSKEDFKNRVPLTNTLFEKLESLKVLDNLEERNQMTLF